MASTNGTADVNALLVVGTTGGITVVDPGTPLKRLNYYDGKFLRAADFDVEQGYLRQLVALSNQGGGPGVVYGYDTVLAAGDRIQVGPGLAIDPSGNVLLLQSTVSHGVQALIDASRRKPAAPADLSGKAGAGAFGDCVELAAPPPTDVVMVSDLYVIAVCTAQALCGQEDVYGVTCQDACASTTDRPYRLDAVVLRAIPLQLVTPLPVSKAVAIDADRYLRAKVAHSWFADEVRRHPDAVSRAGLLSQVWCLGAGYAAGCCEVPLAVVARAGSTTLFLDAWTVRRERIDTPPRRYWQWKMRMRPWDVFLAHVLQFQCQLADLLAGAGVPGDRGGDPCAGAHRAVDEAAQFVEQVRAGLASWRDSATNATGADRPALLTLSMTRISDLQGRLQTVLKDALVADRPTDRVLIRGGLIELPSGGYLPVLTGSGTSVNDQVRALLGEGLDLRFCIVRTDYVAHAVEEVQHMDRISLLQGLDDPADKPRVDILVPEGSTQAVGGTAAGGLYAATLAFSTEQTGALAYRGAAREAALAGGGRAHYSATAGLSQASVQRIQTLAREVGDPASQATLTPTLANSAFVSRVSTLGVRLDNRITAASAQARVRLDSAASRLDRTDAAQPQAAADDTDEAVDGLWLDVRIAERIATLAVGANTALNVRAVLGSHPEAPTAMELSVNGSFTVASVVAAAGGGKVVTGRVAGLMAVSVAKLQPAEGGTTEFLVTRRADWRAVLSYAGDEASGSATLDLTLDEKGRGALRIARSWQALGAQVVYRLSYGAVNADGTPTSQPIGEMRLTADAAVANPSHGSHRYATAGLDMVQAALATDEPSFKANALGLLFPTAAASGDELVIHAARDWVAFVRRRERQCTGAPTPPPALPSRRYRVLNFTTDNADRAAVIAAEIHELLQDPVKLASLINGLVEKSNRSDKVHLVVTYAGGSVLAESDLAAAAADWKVLGPGPTIHYAAAGAADETDASLQTGRIVTFEGAIAADSKPTAATTRDAIVPYPDAARPADADGIMLFVTVRPTQAVVRTALLIHGNWERPDHFVNGESPRTKATFQDDVPVDSKLRDFIAALTPNQPVNGVTLATTRAAPDAGAAKRLQAAIDALVAAGRPAPGPTRRTVEAISDHDRREVTAAGANPDDFDEVIFFELNAGT